MLVIIIVFLIDIIYCAQKKRAGLQRCVPLPTSWCGGHLASDGRAHVPDNRRDLAVRKVADRRTGQVGVSKCSGKGEGPGPTASAQVIAQGGHCTEAGTRPGKTTIPNAGPEVQGFGLDRSPALRGPIVKEGFATRTPEYLGFQVPRWVLIR